MYQPFIVYVIVAVDFEDAVEQLPPFALKVTVLVAVPLLFEHVAVVTAPLEVEVFHCALNVVALFSLKFVAPALHTVPVALDFHPAKLYEYVFVAVTDDLLGELPPFALNETTYPFPVVLLFEGVPCNVKFVPCVLVCAVVVPEVPPFKLYEIAYV